MIARVRAGQPEAYAELVRAHTGIALRAAAALGAGPDAEDVVQQAFVKAYCALGRFRDGAAFRPWLLSIVANETRNTVRAAARRTTLAYREAALVGAEPVIPESADPAVATLETERRAALLAALEKLTEEHRLVVTYRYLLEMDERETAEALGWPRGTVKSRLNRALRRLRRLLPEGVRRRERTAGGGAAAPARGAARLRPLAGRVAGRGDDGRAGARPDTRRGIARPGAPRPRVRAIRHWTRTRRRSLLAALCGLLTVLVLTPPVRATVSDWFGFHGVQVRHDPSAAPSPDARVPGCAAPVRLEEAARRAGFTPVVPEALGPPDTVSVTALPHGRTLISLCWRDTAPDDPPGPVPGPPGLHVHEDGAGTARVAGRGGQGLWFPRPHVLTFWMLDAEGRRFTREERTAGPTLLWSPAGRVTLRLEGAVARAGEEIAMSVTNGGADLSPSGV